MTNNSVCSGNDKKWETCLTAKKTADDTKLWVKEEDFYGKMFMSCDSRSYIMLGFQSGHDRTCFLTVSALLSTVVIMLTKQASTCASFIMKRQKTHFGKPIIYF